MLHTILYIFLALLGLSFLIFIHELGHYFMARRVGMRVEIFSIGFGKPITSFMHEGVKWQVCWLPFGGYVKIAGTETDSKQDPYTIKDGFFGKSPLDRIKVAFAGPLINLFFALFVFTIIFCTGGIQKNYQEFSPRVGWIDPQSALFKHGVRPGDTISAYGTRPYTSFKDHIYEPMLNQSHLIVHGFHTNKDQSTPFRYEIEPYSHPLAVDSSLKTTGIFQSANYIIYDRLNNNKENPLPTGSPLENSGIRYGDRILWVDGTLIASNSHLDHVLNDQRVFLTVQRENKIILARVPRVPASEIRPDAEFKDELIDWQYAAGLKETKLHQLYTIPYNLSYDLEVEGALPFIEQDDEEKTFPKYTFSELEAPLQKGDRILTVGGTPVEHTFELLSLIQSPKSLIIVERNSENSKVMTQEELKNNFFSTINFNDLHHLINSIGRTNQPTSKGNLQLLNPVQPKKLKDFDLSNDQLIWLEKDIQEKKKKIASIEDPKQRQLLKNELEKQQERRYLGLPATQDRKVAHNPNPFVIFQNVLQEIQRTLTGLLTFSISPKFLSGPVGILQVVHDSSKTNLKEALFWLGAISLNLGILNLLPIPVLDGGTIVISFIEMVTKKRLKPKTLEKLILPFALLLISLMIFLTYNDILRAFKRFFS